MSGNTELALILCIDAVLLSTAVGIMVLHWPQLRAQYRQQREEKAKARAAYQQHKLASGHQSRSASA